MSPETVKCPSPSDTCWPTSWSEASRTLTRTPGSATAPFWVETVPWTVPGTGGPAWAPILTGVSRKPTATRARAGKNLLMATSNDRRSKQLIGRPSHHQHGIAVAVEPVAAAHGFPIGAQNAFPAGKSRHQHQQRRLRKVKVRDQAVHQAEPVPGVDEEAG